jgi:hypothetical protein
VHPCINYWLVYRWFFVLQMLRWIWYVLSEQTLTFEVCVS